MEDNKYMDENGIVKELDPYFNEQNLFGNGLSAENMYPGYEGAGHPSKDIKPADLPYMDHVPGAYDSAADKLMKGHHLVDKTIPIKSVKRWSPGAEGKQLVTAISPNVQDKFIGIPTVNGVPIKGVFRPVRPDVSIDIVQLQGIAANLNKKSQAILSTYNDECMTALRNGSECLKISGLDCDVFFKDLDKIYNNIAERIKGLSDFINNDVVANYDVVTHAITNKFNGELVSEINGILRGFNFGGSASHNIPIYSKRQR